jgi:hypothetical protein
MVAAATIPYLKCDEQPTSNETKDVVHQNRCNGRGTADPQSRHSQLSMRFYFPTVSRATRGVLRPISSAVCSVSKRVMRRPSTFK